MRTCDFNADKIKHAVTTILSGNCKRVDVDTNTKVYECKNVIRIDLKVREEEPNGR